MFRNSLLHRWVAIALLGSAALFAGTVSAQTVKVGDRAPAFTLPSSTGKPVTLADYAGKSNVVLFFYIGAFTDT